MFKIKLSISLLISFIFVSCANNNLIFDNRSYSIGYVSGEYDGLVLKNLLTNNLSNFNIYNKDSNYKIEPNISHSSELFITNIDNTSDRIRVDSALTVNVIDERSKCVIHNFEEKISQFYLFADSDRYISNNIAEKKIREENTEALIKNFINELTETETKCKNTYE